MGNVSPLCEYCHQSNELVSHLFWFCFFVQQFLGEVTDYLQQFGFLFTPSKTEMLFGFHNLNFVNPKNYISLIFKRYVWVTKFRNCQLNLNGFIKFLKSYVIDLKYIFELKKDAQKELEWNAIFVALNI